MKIARREGTLITYALGSCAVSYTHLAKGQDELALRIIAVGEESKVPVIENRPLARALYAETEINGEIPPAHYGAVAEILVYIYKLNQKME